MFRHVALIVTLLFFWGGATAWAQKDQCIYCKTDTRLVKLHFVDGAKFVCEGCQKKLPICTICRLPTNLPQYRDLRYFCPSCQKLGVFAESAATALQKQVLNFLQSQLGSATLPPIRMCDKDELQTKMNEHGRAVDVIGFYSPYNPEQVYLLTGVPPIELQSTMTHEYTHAWQSRNCPQQDRALSEGFACWVTYKFLLSKNETSRAERIRRHQDPDYGASLNKLLEREQRIGAKALVEWVKKARNVDDK